MPINVTSTNGNEAIRNSYNLRIFLLLFIVTAFIALVFFRLFNLQVVNYKYYQAMAANQHGFEQTILPKRGDIYLISNSGDPVLVATNVTKHLVYAVPKEIKDAKSTANKLSALLGLPAAELVQKISSNSLNYVPLKKQLPDDVSNQIKELKLPGIYQDPESVRLYPEDKLASHVLGFVGYKGDSRVGQYGVEGKFEENLSGANGIMGLEKDLAGRWITFATRNLIPATDGDDIYLTIDPAIQFKTQEVLRATVESHKADGGSITVINPKTGAIMALAVSPDFNPNEYNKVSNIGVYSNTVLAADYEPGSVFKPITMAAALNAGSVTPEMTYEDKGEVDVDDRKIKNSDPQPNGMQTMTQVLEKSLNTGAVFVEQQLGHDNFKKYVKQFGFGKLTNLELPGEVLGNLDSLNKKGDIFFATASFGQGITVTPVQLASAYTAIANGGKLMKPYLVSKVVHADQTEEDNYPKEVGQVINSKTAAQVSAMLVNVVENGHGKKAAVKGYYIAGKTGTAQVAFPDKPG
ncbi:MAG TPA: penicillin-binding protein 2, partial [Patescibacteria group bacterium]|nr:penicillin-binding protein 2 [Patescibacteria group bacterium]